MRLCNLLKTNIMKNITIDGVEYAPIIKEDYKRLTQTLDFEVYHKDLGQLKWEDAVEACEKLGEGWRLPTRTELLLIYENKDKIGGFANSYYWSSTENDGLNAWYHNFNSEYQNTYNKDYTFNVRPIKDIKQELTSSTPTGILNTLNINHTGKSNIYSY